MFNNRCAVWDQSYNDLQMSAISEYVGASDIGGLGDMGHWLLKTNVLFGDALIYKDNINSGQFSTTHTCLNISGVSKIGKETEVSIIG